MKAVSIPLKSGLFVIIAGIERKIKNLEVSIPLKSGLFVIQILNDKREDLKRFNPLKIGSICNTRIKI